MATTKKSQASKKSTIVEQPIVVEVMSKEQAIANNLPPIEEVVVTQLPDGTAEELIAELMPEKKRLGRPKKVQEVQEVKEEKPEFKLQEIAVDENGQATIPLASLIALDSTPITNARYVMRELNKQHLEHMQIAYENGTTFPPIRVAGSTHGNIVIDGQHRWNTYKTAKAPPENIVVEPLNGLTEREVAKRTGVANRENGLPMSDSSRSRYAIYLLLDAAENGEKLKVVDAAKLAGVSRIAVYRQIGRDKAKEEKMIDNLGLESEEAEAVEAEEKLDSEKDKLAPAIKRLFAAIKVLAGEVNNQDMLTKYLEDFTTKGNYDSVHFVAMALREVEQPAK